MSNQSVTYSKARFPNGDYEEVAKAKFDQSKNAYVDFSLDIGWAVRGGHSSRYSKPKPEIRRYKRKCCGHIVCENDNCKLKNQQLRPCGDKKALEKQLEKSCATCGFRLAHYECPVKAFFRFSGEQCVLQHKGIHNHNVEDTYLTKHLSVEESQKIDDAVRNTHNLRAKAATVGINPKTGQVMPSLREINLVLGNRERAAYEIGKSKSRLHANTKGDLFTAFEEIQNAYKNYIIYANVQQVFS